MTVIQPFKIEKNPEVYTLRDVNYKLRFGIFAKTYVFDGPWDKTQEDTMTQWLSHNCNDNFIFLKKTSTIMAGGTTDHVASLKGIRKRRLESTISEYHVRLHTQDVMLFEMVWLTLM